MLRFLLTLLALGLVHPSAAVLFSKFDRRKFLTDAAAAAAAKGPLQSSSNQRSAVKGVSSPPTSKQQPAGSRSPPSPAPSPSPTSRPPQALPPRPRLPSKGKAKTRAGKSRAVVDKKPLFNKLPGFRQPDLGFPRNFFRWCRGLSSSERFQAPYYITGTYVFIMMAFGKFNVKDSANASPPPTVPTPSAATTSTPALPIINYKIVSYRQLQAYSKRIGVGRSGKQLIKGTLKQTLLVQLLEYHRELKDMTDEEIIMAGKDAVGGTGPWDDRDREAWTELLMSSYTDKLVNEDKRITKAKVKAKPKAVSSKPVAPKG